MATFTIVLRLEDHNLHGVVEGASDAAEATATFLYEVLTDKASIGSLISTKMLVALKGDHSEALEVEDAPEE